MRRSLITLVLLGILPLVAAILNSCDGCNDDQTTYEAFNFKAKPFRILRQDRDNNRYELTNYSNEAIRYDSLGLDISYELQVISELINKTSLINAAYACDPPLAFNQITSLEVFSNKDYDASHPSGTDLSDIISYSKDAAVEPQFNFPGFPLGGSTIFLRFLKAPLHIQTHQISIHITYTGSSDGFVALPAVSVKITP